MAPLVILAYFTLQGNLSNSFFPFFFCVKLNSEYITAMNQTGSIKKFVLQTFICLVLLGGGIIILALRIAGWSLFLGLPMILFGVVFLIFTFDHLARNKFGKESLQIVLCSVCGRPTPSPCWQNENICPECEKKIAQKLKEEKKKK
jgi:hypothetical protein